MGLVGQTFGNDPTLPPGSTIQTFNWMQQVIDQEGTPDASNLMTIEWVSDPNDISGKSWDTNPSIDSIGQSNVSGTLADGNWSQTVSYTVFDPSSGITYALPNVYYQFTTVVNGQLYGFSACCKNPW